MACVSSCPKTYNNIGLGRPKNAMTQSSVPNEKNQNSSDAQKRCCTVAVEKLLKNARVTIQAGGIRKTAMICFNQRTGTTHSVFAHSSCASRPVLSLRRRRFLTVGSTAAGAYQRPGPKASVNRNCATVHRNLAFLRDLPCALLLARRAASQPDFALASVTRAIVVG
jgi:hypothetical protein